MNRFKDFIKIISALVIAFIIVSLASSTLFIQPTPRINPLFFADIKTYLADLFPKKNSAFSYSSLPLNALTPLSKGVYAINDKVNKTIYIRFTNDVEWDEKVIQSEGKTYTIRFPKGMMR